MSLTFWPKTFSKVSNLSKLKMKTIAYSFSKNIHSQTLLISLERVLFSQNRKSAAFLFSRKSEFLTLPILSRKNKEYSLTSCPKSRFSNKLNLPKAIMTLHFAPKLQFSESQIFVTYAQTLDRLGRSLFLFSPPWWTQSLPFSQKLSFC